MKNIVCTHSHQKVQVRLPAFWCLNQPITTQYRILTHQKYIAVENNCEKRRNCLLQAISPFSHNVFSI